MKKAEAIERKVIAQLGPVAFYIGLLIALGTAFIEPTKLLYVGLGVLGVIVGVLNITARETGLFLLASIAFIVGALGMYSLISVAGPGVVISEKLVRLAANLATLVGAAAMVVALRAIYETAKGK